VGNVGPCHHCFIAGSVMTAKLTCVVEQGVGLQRPGIEPSLILHLEQLTGAKGTLDRSVFLGSVPSKMEDYGGTIPSISPFGKSL
jgi:hypothetical protein